MAAGCDQSRGELKMEEKMLKLNDTVMYGTTGVCTVENIEKKTIGKVTRTYYVLRPKAQTSSTVFLPADNEILLGKVRTVMTADEIIGIIRELPAEPNIWVDDDNERKLRYNEIITSGDRKRCLLMIRTLRSHQKELAEKGKRLHIADCALDNSVNRKYRKFYFGRNEHSAVKSFCTPKTYQKQAKRQDTPCRFLYVRSNFSLTV